MPREVNRRAEGRFPRLPSPPSLARVYGVPLHPLLPPHLGNPIAAPGSWRGGAFAILIQEVDAYLAWADKHAGMVTLPRYVTLQRALADAFPCPK